MSHEAEHCFRLDHEPVASASTPAVARIALRSAARVGKAGFFAPAIRRRSRENSMSGCVQATAESPERDVQLADDILPILAYEPREFPQPYSAANRGRTNKRRPICERPARCHVASPNRS